MSRRQHAALIAGWLAGLLLGMGGPAQAAAVQASDDSGRVIALAAPARRIVSLAPHLTELLHAAGAGARQVARSRFCNQPAEVARLPVVGDAFTVDFEALLLLKPDLVLVWGSGTPDRVKQKLRSLGLNVFEAEIRDVAGISATLRRIGTLAGTSPEAEPRAAALARDWSALVAAHANRSPVRVFFQLWDAPLMTLSGQHGISQAIRACGGRNVFEELPTLTATVSWEVAVQRDPQVVLSSGSAAEPASFGRWKEFRQVSATRHQQFVMLDGDLITRMGPRFIDGARQLCNALEAARRAH